jgi:hypothetical protein
MIQRKSDTESLFARVTLNLPAIFNIEASLMMHTPATSKHADKMMDLPLA